MDPGQERRPVFVRGQTPSVPRGTVTVALTVRPGIIGPHVPTSVKPPTSGLPVLVWGENPSVLDNNGVDVPNSVTPGV